MWYWNSYRFTAIAHAEPNNTIVAIEQSLVQAGFTNVTRSPDGWSVAADFNTFLGTPQGDISVSVTLDGIQTRLMIYVRAEFDNIRAVFRSPGERIATKFLDSLVSRAPVSGFVAAN